MLDLLEFCSHSGKKHEKNNMGYFMIFEGEGGFEVKWYKGGGETWFRGGTVSGVIEIGVHRLYTRSIAL